jgi:tetratricopeptide (TPR) repeat protein
MSNAPFASPIEADISRVRELSMKGHYAEALAAASTLLVEAPGNRDLLYLIAANQRCLGQISEALAASQRLEQQHPDYSLLYQERGHCYVHLRDADRAIDAFRRAVDLNPALVTSWIMLERLYRMTGQQLNAATAAEQVAALNQLPPGVVRAGGLFADGDLSAAENILRGYLRTAIHAEALRLLGRIQHQRKVLDEAERLLEGAAKLAPDYRAARLDYVRVLIERQKYHQAVRVIEPSLEPGDHDSLLLYAAASAGLGHHDKAIPAYRELTSASLAAPELHVALGHSLQSVGRQKEAIGCYRTAAAIRPCFGDAYWSLANLKTYRFSDDEIARMREMEAAPFTHLVDRYHFCFALGKACEDQRNYAESWQFYERGNRLKRAGSNYDPEVAEINTHKQIEACTAQLFATRTGAGAPHRDPIFIVGLPRSGSTLLEQILASHSQVEGTHELYDIPRLVLELEGDESDPKNPRYPALLTHLTPEDLRRLGERYLADTRAYRRGKRLFIDKMLNNFRHIGLIHLMLPNAKIIDARREPMACCFSNLKQLFASGQEFTYNTDYIARYYRTYLDLMGHWNAVLPGGILKVFYEDVVEDVAANVRRILEFCGLEFEPACIEFFKTDRGVQTASSEQVRQPIFREGLFQWRNYEPWLGPLGEALGDALIRYRD